jgi:uncharacterized protein (DUF58 family)
METPLLIRRALLQGSHKPAIAGQSAASRRRGEGYEFAELRAYVTGDDPRRIDWAATARVGALQSRVMLEEHALFLVSILDESASMQLGQKLPRITVARDALLLWNQAGKATDRMLMVGEDESFEARGASPELAARACAAQSLQTVNIEVSLRHADAIVPKGSAILLITDGWSPIDDATIYQMSTRHDCTLLFVRDPWYNGLPLRGFVRMRDAETGLTQQFFFKASDEQRYLQAVREREDQIQKRFSLAGWRVAFLGDDPHESFRVLFAPELARF